MDDPLSLSFSRPPGSGRDFAAVDPATPDEPGATGDAGAVYLAGRRNGDASGWLEELDSVGPTLVEPPFDGLVADAAPGLVLIAPEDLSAVELLQILHRVARGRGEWLPAVLLREEDGGSAVRPLSLGYPHPVSQALAAAGGGDDQAPVLEFRRILDRISRARHDLNNPLTSALAETQLLLMDVTEPEIRDALETVQRQLRRMRDMIQELRPLRFTDV